ncbi:MAG TPA: tetratricopeptide repeat protein, partial [Pyrinomonadaceae bacterium]|nr:tetratricopeptide repeat protein [Pyrinomonadaceae bacterium]
GFALLAKAQNTSDAAAAKQLRARAHTAFVNARKAGDKTPLVAGMIESTPADGGTGATFTNHEKADDIMQKAEAAFARGNMDEALEFYQKALKIDPTLYHAALFSGDVYMQKGKFGEAETWYQRAIAINPYIETAYRYSATPLMKQGKYDEARDRYVEAYVTEPYSNFAINGIVQWGQATRTKLGHPKIDPPKATPGKDGKMQTTINVNPLDDDGSMGWMAYLTTREDWSKEKFAKEYPAEKTYRHSVREEADALRSVVSVAKTLKPKKLNEQIALIEQMDKDGVLEAYIIMAMPDKGIAVEHADYLRKNRDKLKLYVTKYVIAK